MRRTQRLKSTGYQHPDTGARFAPQIVSAPLRVERDLTGIDFGAVLAQIAFRGLSQTGRDKTWRVSRSTLRAGEIEPVRMSRPRLVSMRRLLLESGTTPSQLRHVASTLDTREFYH